MGIDNKPIRPVQAGCFDVCPKQAVMALRASRPGRWLAVPAGREAADVLAALGIGHPAPPVPKA